MLPNAAGMLPTHIVGDSSSTCDRPLSTAAPISHPAGTAAAAASRCTPAARAQRRGKLPRGGRKMGQQQKQCAAVGDSTRASWREWCTSACLEADDFEADA